MEARPRAAAMSQQGLGSSTMANVWSGLSWIEAAACTGNTTSLLEAIPCTSLPNLSRLTVAPNMDLVLQIIIAVIVSGSPITTASNSFVRSNVMMSFCRRFVPPIPSS